MPFVQATIDKQGRLYARVGKGGQKSKMDDQRWVEVFTRAGLPAVFEPNMLLWLRCHVPLCIAFESVSVAGSRRGGGAAWKASMVLARGVQESYTLLQRLGYEIYPSGKRGWRPARRGAWQACCGLCRASLPSANCLQRGRLSAGHWLMPLWRRHLRRSRLFRCNSFWP